MNIKWTKDQIENPAHRRREQVGGWRIYEALGSRRWLPLATTEGRGHGGRRRPARANPSVGRAEGGGGGGGGGGGRGGEEEVKGWGLWSGTSVWWMEEGRLSTSLSVMYGDN